MSTRVFPITEILGDYKCWREWLICFYHKKAKSTEDGFSSYCNFTQNPSDIPSNFQPSYIVNIVLWELLADILCQVQPRHMDKNTCQNGQLCMSKWHNQIYFLVSGGNTLFSGTSLGLSETDLSIRPDKSSWSNSNLEMSGL